MAKVPESNSTGAVYRAAPHLVDAPASTSQNGTKKAAAPSTPVDQVASGVGRPGVVPEVAPSVTDPARAMAEKKVTPNAAKARGRVALKVYTNDPTEPASVRYLPSSAFTLKGGHPVGLEGPHVKIVQPDFIGTEAVIDEKMREALETTGPTGFLISSLLAMNKQLVPNPSSPTSPSRDDAFLPRDAAVEMGQTTAFYAANQVHDVARRGAGLAAIPWGAGGQLAIVAAAYVTTRPHEMNATAFLGAASQLEFGVAGRIDGGEIAPVTPETLSASLRASRDLLVSRRERWQAELAAGQTHRAKDIELIGRLIDSYDARLAGKFESWEVHAAMSREVAAHEAGHAVLGALKPGWRAGSGITGGFHEGYGDFVSLLTALKDPLLIDRVLTETGGDLRRSHHASRMAEQLGAFWKRNDPDPANDGENYLRDVANPLRRGDFGEFGLDEASPSDAEPTAGKRALSLESHSLGRLFSGTWNELLSAFYDERLRAVERPSRSARRRAVTAAADDVATLVHRSLAYLPEQHVTARQVGRAMILADVDHLGGTHLDTLERVLRDRGLLDESPAVIVAHRRDGVPKLVLPPTVRRNDDVVAALSADVRRALDYSGTEKELGGKPKDWAPEVVSDATDDHGFRTIRLLRPEIVPSASSLTTAPSNGLSAKAKNFPSPRGTAPRSTRMSFDVTAIDLRRYAALLFDPSGNLVALHSR